MSISVKYDSEIKKVSLGDKKIRLENFTPIFPAKEQEQRKREVEIRLFDVFSKYENLKSAN